MPISREISHEDEFPLTETLRVVLKAAREEAGLTFRALDKAADIDQSRANRFERGKAGVNDLDAHVVGYARATGRAPSSLWQEAVDLCCRNHGPGTSDR
jgi:transcriptional regulator with XRE-family HTH domain